MKPSLLQISLSALLLQALVSSAGSKSFSKTADHGFRDLAQKAKLKHVGQWLQWKQRHNKQYESSLEELERHLVWLSNKRYIEQHNANSHIFGFTLAMNHLGDVVSK